MLEDLDGIPDSMPKTDKNIPEDKVNLNRHSPPVSKEEAEDLFAFLKTPSHPIDPEIE